MRRLPWPLTVAAIAVAVGIALGVGVMTSRRADDRSTVDDPGLVHVHGIGVNPGDGLVYAATHTGLFRVGEDGSADRIADRYQDTMGFTVAGADRFLASGHPDLRDQALRRPGRPPLLGLVESTDAGRTWEPVSLLGDADLHTIVAVGEALVAYDSTGERVLFSADGRDWETRSSIALLDLAADPADADRLVAIDAGGGLVDSRDGGRTWTPRDAEPPALQVLRWGGAGLWGASGDGSLYRLDEDAQSWSVVKRFDGPVEALLVEDLDVYAAVGGAGIYRSSDGGKSWDEVVAAD